MDVDLNKPFRAYNGTEPYVFVCYAHGDSDSVYSDLMLVHSKGIHLWYDEGIPAGSSWRAEIATAIKGATKFLFYISESSLASAHCLREVDYALSNDIEIIPVYLDDSSLPGELELVLNRVQALFRARDSEYIQHLLGGLQQSTPFAPLLPLTNKRSLRIGLSVLALALTLAYFAFDKFVLDPVEDEQIALSARQEGLTAALSEPPGDKSIAVLPFDNRSNREEDQFFTDGIHDDLLTTIAKIGSMKVISRTSVMEYKNTIKKIPEIAKELGVANILEGGIQRSGNQVRINVQLIDAATDKHLWAEIYDRELTAENLFAVQSDITRMIADALQAELSTDEQLRIDAIPTDNLQAYEAYMRGRLYFDTFRPDTLAQARQHFTSALSNDPLYVEAHVGLALSYVAGGFFGLMPAATAYREAERSANRALELDQDNGVALTVLGWVEFVYRWNWAEAERMMRKAVEKQPNSPWTHYYLANYLSAMDRPDEAVEAINAALRLDPVSTYGLVARGYILNNAHRGAEAVKHWLTVQDRLGLSLIANFLILTYERMGDFDSAVSVAEELARKDAARLRLAFSEDSEHGYWKALAAEKEEILSRYPDRFSMRYAVAMSKIGDLDTAIDMLERGYHQRNPSMVFLPIYPLQALYREPRFQEIVNKMNLQDIMLDELKLRTSKSNH